MIQESVKFHTEDNRTIELRVRNGVFSATLWKSGSGRSSESLIEFFEILCAEKQTLKFVGVNSSRTTETDFKMLFEKSNKS